MTKHRQSQPAFNDKDLTLPKTELGPAVLLVDDNPASRTLAGATLRRFGCRIVMAGDGEKALEILDSGTPPVDVVVTDLDMPRVGGLELLRRIRESGKHKDVPVIFWSGNDDPEMLNKAAEWGCTLYLPKPIELEVLFEQLTCVLPRKATPNSDSNTE